MYTRPGSVRYSSQDLAELLGPVETQYAPEPDCTGCLVDAQGTPFQMEITVDVGDCLNFEQCVLVLTDMQNQMYSLTRVPGDGSQVGNEWTTVLTPEDVYGGNGMPTVTLTGGGGGGIDQRPFDTGTWEVSATLSDADETAAPCSTSFDVLFGDEF